MGKSSVVFELNDREIRVFWFSALSFKKLGHNSIKVKFDRIPIPTGIIEQGTVRNENTLISILSAYKSRNPGNCQRVYLAISQQQGFIKAYPLPWLDRKSVV